MKHSFLFATQEWLAEGDYYDEKGNRFNLTGISQIVCDKDKWTITGFMEVLFKNPTKFYNNYNIKKSDSDDNIPWESYNPALGRLIGNMSISGDTITSRYTSEDGTCSGFETLRQIDEQTYENKGECHVSGKRISSWSAILKAKM